MSYINEQFESRKQTIESIRKEVQNGIYSVEGFIEKVTKGTTFYSSDYYGVTGPLVLKKIDNYKGDCAELQGKFTYECNGGRYAGHMNSGFVGDLFAGGWRSIRAVFLSYDDAILYMRLSRRYVRKLTVVSFV